MRLLYFLIVLITAVALPWWIALPFFAFYAFRFQAYELIALGVLLDAYFGYMLPWHVAYTTAAGVLCIVAELLKPRISLYERNP